MGDRGELRFPREGRSELLILQAPNKPWFLSQLFSSKLRMGEGGDPRAKQLIF